MCGGDRSGCVGGIEVGVWGVNTGVGGGGGKRCHV